MRDEGVGDTSRFQPIVPLNESHVRTSFQSGVGPLDRYLVAQAGQDQRRRVAACFVIEDARRTRVVGYYTLSAYSVIANALPDAVLRKLPRYGQIPCTLLGRLAVDLEHRGTGLGEHLLLDALRRAVIHSAQIASWAVVVDAKEASANTFYARYGFIPLRDAPTRLFLPMATIARVFG